MASGYTEASIKTLSSTEHIRLRPGMYLSLIHIFPAHEVATVFMNTGSLRITKPSMGSWVVYGLGTENQNLPGFIALRSGGLPSGGAANYGSAFLPGVFQGSSVNTQAANVQQMIRCV